MCEIDDASTPTHIEERCTRTTDVVTISRQERDRRKVLRDKNAKAGYGLDYTGKRNGFGPRKVMRYPKDFVTKYKTDSHWNDIIKKTRIVHSETWNFNNGGYFPKPESPPIVRGEVRKTRKCLGCHSCTARTLFNNLKGKKTIVTQQVRPCEFTIYSCQTGMEIRKDSCSDHMREGCVLGKIKSKRYTSSQIQEDHHGKHF